MGRKRKGAAPRRVDESKHHLLSWNMYDQQADVTVLDDDDPLLAAERQSSQLQLQRKPKPPIVISGFEDNELIKEMANQFDYYIGVKNDSTPVGTSKPWHCILGCFNIFTLGNDIPDNQEFWLYVNEDETDYLLYYEMDNQMAIDPDQPSTSSQPPPAK